MCHSGPRPRCLRNPWASSSKENIGSAFSPALKGMRSSSKLPLLRRAMTYCGDALRGARWRSLVDFMGHPVRVRRPERGYACREPCRRGAGAVSGVLGQKQLFTIRPLLKASVTSSRIPRSIRAGAGRSTRMKEIGLFCGTLPYAFT